MNCESVTNKKEPLSTFCSSSHKGESEQKNEKGVTEKLAVADLEHVQENHHTIQWEETLHGAGPWQGTEAGCGGGPVCTFR